MPKPFRVKAAGCGRRVDTEPSTDPHLAGMTVLCGRLLDLRPGRGGAHWVLCADCSADEDRINAVLEHHTVAELLEGHHPSR